MKEQRPGRKPSIRIVIADDHPIVREGLRALLKTQRDIEVLADAATGQEALDQVLTLQPDLLLLDLRMPGMSGTSVLRAIPQISPATKVIMLSSYGGDQDIAESMQAGARAYLLKDSPRQELLECIRAVHAGRMWIPPQVGAALAARSQSRELTEREVEIIRRIVEGKSNKEIAISLGISDSTVKVHLRQIFKKLHASNRLDALRIALQRGIAQLGGQSGT